MSWAMWITGLPGSGKSTVARALARALEAAGERVVVLELDEVRKILTPRPTYQDGERQVVYRALVYLATVLTSASVPVIIDATGHRRAWRDLARASITHFAEVQLLCPLEVCQERERQRVTGHAPRGIYAAASQPGATVPGVDVPYEPALQPDAVVDTSREAIDAAVTRLVPLALGLAPRTLDRVATPGDGWAIWITGLPGSGKTTLAAGVAEHLTAQGVAVHMLDFGAACGFVLAGARPGAVEEDLIHRTLVTAAMLLARAGAAVIIDATGRRRVRRELARRLIPRFAEVQLQCALEICARRERAVRWGFVPRPQGGRLSRPHPGGPDLIVDYQESLNADLTLRTDVRDVDSASEDVLRLVARLERTPATRPQRA